MSSDKIDVFDPNSLKEKVVCKVREAFVDLITLEQWETMVTKVIADFAQPPESKYHRGAEPESVLQRIIREEVEVIFRALVRAELESGGYLGQWRDSGIAEPSDMVKKIIEESAPILVQSMFANIAQSMVERIKMDFQNGMPFGG